MAENNIQPVQRRYLSVRETIIYGVANGGQVLGYNMMTGQQMYFLLNVLGVPPAAVTLMVLLMGFWDAFNDPLMGSIVDKTRTRYGKLRPYLIFVPIFLGITTVLFFGGAEFLKDVKSDTVKIIYMCITYFLWEITYTIGDIPFWGLSAAISPNPADRSTAIKSARFISGIVGGLPGIIIPICIDNADKTPFTIAQVFLFLAIFAGTFGMFLFSLSGLCTRERVQHSNEEPKLLDCFIYMFKNKPLLLLVISNILSAFEGIGGHFSQYYYKISLGVASLSLLVGIPGTLTGWLTYAIMSKLEKRFRSKQIVVGVSIFNTSITVLVFLIGSRNYTNMAVIAPLMAILGVFNSVSASIKAVIPTKMIGETVDYMEWKTGIRNEGMAFSVLTFVGKLTGSLSKVLATLIVPFVGLKGVGEELVLSPNTTVNTRFWLWALITVIPSVLGLLALIPYKLYDLEGEKLERIQKENRERNELKLNHNIAE